MVIRKLELNPEDILITFNVENLEDGLFFYQIISNDNRMIDTGEFVVLK